MFKNPLKKYAAGGVTNAQKQELVQVFSKAASKLQIEPEVLIQKAQELTGEEQAGFMQAIQDVADNDQPRPESLQFIQNVFRKSGQSSQAFKDGGKIHDFICKHARGGHVADCGCKQEGGNVEKAQNGLKAIAPGFRYLGEYSIQDKFNPRINHVAWHGYEVNGENTAVPTKQGGYWSGMNYDSVYNNEGEKTMSRSMFDNLEDFYTRALPESNQVKTLDQEKLAGMENGGKVLKGQRGLSSGRFDIPFGAYMKAYFNKRSTPDVGAATNRSFGYSTSNGNEYYLEDANVGRSSVDTWVNVTPKKDTIIMQKLPSDHINDLEDYQMEAIMQRMRPDIKRVNSKK